MPITEFVSGQWYLWTGGGQRPPSWSTDGRMDFLLDGKPHQVQKGHGSSASFVDSPYSLSFSADLLGKFELVILQQEAQGWACAACTLMNSSALRCCGACGLARGPRQATPTTVAMPSVSSEDGGPRLSTAAEASDEVQNLRAALREKDEMIEKLIVEARQAKAQALLSPEGVAALNTSELEAHVQRLKEALRVAEELQKERLACVVCLERPRRVVFLPCWHKATCEGCSATLKECPMCRREISERSIPFE
eukprot:RCo007883